jgi:hypothetical protein
MHAMNRKVIAIATLVVVIATICIWVCRRSGEHQPSARTDGTASTLPGRRASEPQNVPSVTLTSATESKSAPEPEPLVHYEMVQTNVAVDPDVEAKSKKTQPFQLRGGGSGAAKIVDLEGKTVLESVPYNTIASCSVSPDGGRILVYHGNSDYEIFDPASKSRALLPQRPPGEKKLAFSAWHWINDAALLGQSGDELTDRRDVAGEDAMEIRGRLYLYNIGRKELAEFNCLRIWELRYSLLPK